jgi:hypothetical protein
MPYEIRERINPFPSFLNLLFLKLWAIGLASTEVCALFIHTESIPRGRTEDIHTPPQTKYSASHFCLKVLANFLLSAFLEI